MAYKITDECIACGTCASECPVEAITEGDGIFVIDADACIECHRRRRLHRVRQLRQCLPCGSPQGRVNLFDKKALAA